MPKARRYFERGHHYHLTHRCHNRAFFLKFSRDLKVYREMLRSRSKRFHTPVLGYCLTSNHVHLLVTAVDGTGISAFMDALQGDFAQYYNLRKKRTGAFWSGRFHATAIERSEHLWNCLSYIELNMVRAGVVAHPSEWPWCSYGELIGLRKRYRVIDRDHFGFVFGRHPDEERFMSAYRGIIEHRLAQRRLIRERCWSEGLAIGSEEYVRGLSGKIPNRYSLLAEPLENELDTKTWVLKEPRADYA